MLKVSQVIERGLIRTQESLNSKFMVFVLPFPQILIVLITVVA